MFIPIFAAVVLFTIGSVSLASRLHLSSGQGPLRSVAPASPSTLISENGLLIQDNALVSMAH